MNKQTESFTKLQVEQAIDYIKTTFLGELKGALQLVSVSAPIAVRSGTGINDDLNGHEEPVSFRLPQMEHQKAEVVHSLAKWKRMRLAELGIPAGQGIVTHMLALRPCEQVSALHSVLVDQWDWEKHILPTQRTRHFLKEAVRSIYGAIKRTEYQLSLVYPGLSPVLPDDITFVSAEELLQQYPHLTPKERETEATRQYGAVFLLGIGGALSDGRPHDGRAPDYDDWSTPQGEGESGINGDILLWHSVLNVALEVSSMGIRVDREALLRQLQLSGQQHRLVLDFHQQLVSGQLPQSIGGGIGQSRLCLFLLRRSHIGEVNPGIWPEAYCREYKSKGVEFL